MRSCKARFAGGGHAHEVFYLVEEGDCLVEEFLAELKRGDVAAHKRATLALQRLAEHGVPRNEERAKQLEPDLWELKGHQVRLFFFLRGHRAFFTHGFKKKRDGTPETELGRARRLRDAFLAQGQEVEP